MQQAIQRLTSADIEELSVDKKTEARSMLECIQADYKKLNDAVEDDSLFDPE